MKTANRIMLIMSTISILLMVWFGASIMEIISKNTQPNPTYSEANLIVKLVGEGINND